MTTRTITREQVEDFLYTEAALLDEWRLDEWLTLFDQERGGYYMPTTDHPDGDHNTDLFLIADDMPKLRSRVEQLLSGLTWAENPRSRTRRLVTNFRILEAGPDNVVATANFAVWRFQHDATDVYVGRYVNVLVRGPAGLLFRERRVVLDLETLRPHGKLSFIL